MMIKAKDIRYIKLGKKGRWEGSSIDRNELHFGHGKVPHPLATTLSLDKIKAHRISQGRNARAAGDDAREIIDFYSLGEDCLWVTFARGHMWWTFAQPAVHWLGGNGKLTGERMRKCIGGWRNTDIFGRPLTIDSLSTKLTKVSGYRRTICKVDRNYVLRRINGNVEPVVLEANKATEKLVSILNRAIRELHQNDFETLVDIIFARSGWHRVSALGGSQKTKDLALEQPVINERCAIQVKSSASKRELEQFISACDENGEFDRIFFVCHTLRGKLTTDRADVYIWSSDDLSRISFKLGLTDWILEKIA
jgi:hypothetical protein